MKADTTAKTILTATIPFLIILGSLSALLSSESFFNDELSKNRVYDSIEHTEARETTSSVISYIKSSSNSIESRLLTADEITHLADVRRLVRTATYVLYAAAILAVLSLAVLITKNRRLLFLSAYHGGIITAATVASMLLLTAFAFSQSFVVFHKILFSNNLWLLPAGSALTTLFPEQLFIDSARRIGLNSIIISSILILIGRTGR